MTRRIPILPTIIVLAAAATMIALGIWQLGRADEKAAMLARYRQAQTMSSEVAFPTTPAQVERALYRHARVTCSRVLDRRVTAARSMKGQLGLAQVVRCALEGGDETEIALGWSPTPALPEWNGGQVGGFVAPASEGARLIAAPPIGGLEPLPPPDPNDLPNNHLAYAGQWFFFALTALVIYVLALRRRRSS